MDKGLGRTEVGRCEAELFAHNAVEWHNPLAAAGNRCIPSLSMGFSGMLQTGGCGKPQELIPVGIPREFCLPEMPQGSTG